MHKVTKARRIEAGWTMGVDLGDRFSQLCILDDAGVVVSQERVATTPELLERHFGALPRLRVAMEAGTHSPWVSRLIAKCGHETIVGNPRRMRSISAGLQKSDRVDAEQIARLARSDLKFLSPITHRSEEAQRDLALIHARDALVRTRTLLVQHVRCTLKSCGVLVRKCSAEVFPKRMVSQIPVELQTALLPALEIVASLNVRIRRFDEEIERIAAERYQVSRTMCAIAGVGTLTATAYILTIADVRRFKKSRDVGAYIGLTPRATRRCGSRRRETRSCVGCWSGRRTTSSDRLVPSAICVASGPSSPRAAARARRSAPSSPSRASSPCCCIVCGSPVRSTRRCARNRPRLRPRLRP
jgi:transposase